jgi:hypothetical protein
MLCNCIKNKKLHNKLDPQLPFIFIDNNLGDQIKDK